MRFVALRAPAGVAAALFVLALAWAAASADAATYTVWSCRGPAGEPLGTQAWRAFDAGARTSDTCAEGGALSARLTAAKLAARSRAKTASHIYRVAGHRFAPPPGAAIAGYRIHMFAATADARPLSYRAAGLDDDGGFGHHRLDAGCLFAGCVFGRPAPPLSDANLVEAGGLESDGLAIVARCGGLGGCGGEGETAAEVRMFRSQVDVRDDEPPALIVDPGPLASGQPVSGTATVTAGAEDGGGGVAELALLVDGAVLSRVPAGGACEQPYVVAAPCPGRLAASLAVDTSRLTPGSHQAEVRALDAAGNITTGAAISFSVAAQPPASSSPPPPIVIERLIHVPVPGAPKAVAITASRTRISLPDKGEGIAGIVRDADGTPVAGASVLVRSRPFGVWRARLRTERTLTTDAAGRFRGPAGARSRLVVLEMTGGHRAEEPVEIELTERLGVSATPTHRNLRNGGTLTLRVNVAGTGGAAEGKVVLVQAIRRGRWRTIETLPLDAAGRATWRYRFQRTTIRALYSLRVRVERSGDVWPWATTSSPVLKVAVRP